MPLTKVRRGGTDTGISDSSDATAITIDSNEQVGIGATSMGSETFVVEKSSGTPTIRINAPSGSEAQLKLQADNTITDTQLVASKTDGSLTFSRWDGSAYAERMRINSSGFVGINTDNPVNQLHVNNSGNEVFCLERSGKSSGSGFAGFNIEGNSQLTICYDDGSNYVIGTASNPSTQAGFTQRFKLSSNGNCFIPGVYSNTTSNSANVACHYSSGDITRSTSSRRYKNTIKDLDVGLSELNKLRTVSFKGNNDGDIIFNGLIAEEVHNVGLTQFVEYDDENKPDGLRYPHMVSLCIKAIQELSTKVNDLEARIKKLEGG